jgi:hypothetical protein
MSTTYPLITRIDEVNTFEKPIDMIGQEVKPGGAIQVLDADEYITEQQRRWWKGILLKSLSNDTGDSIHWWETYLKRTIMPDKFMPTPIASGKRVVNYVPSITILSKNQMTQMIKGSILELHDEEKHGDRFLGYTLPDKSKRKNWGWDKVESECEEIEAKRIERIAKATRN